MNSAKILVVEIPTGGMMPYWIRRLYWTPVQTPLRLPKQIHHRNQRLLNRSQSIQSTLENHDHHHRNDHLEWK